MWDDLVNFIEFVEPLFLVVIPLCFSIWLKLKMKIIEEKSKIFKEEKEKLQQDFIDWRHEESIKVVTKLKELCNYYCDTSHVHTAYIQLENGTLATSNLCNMFFSCIAEDNRYSKNQKLTNNIQRVPFVQMSDWFNNIANSEHKIVYIFEKKDIDEVFSLESNIKSMLACLVRNTKGIIIGVCIFYFLEEKTLEELDDFKEDLISFSSGVETIFFTYDLNTKEKKKELNI